jgi:bifunctional non-homologous end joining protein LigD
MALEKYREKRRFDRTPEPRGRERRRAGGALRFVVQKHAASRLHYDFRLELDGVLKSWAIPKGPSLVPGDRRFATQTEDHPIEYAAFEGVIPKGEYGGGTVMVWDEGTWEPVGDPRRGLDKGELTFLLSGHKLRGRFHLVRLRGRNGSKAGKSDWLIFKGRDAEARASGAPSVTDSETRSVVTGRDMDEIARDKDRVWSSESGEVDVPGARPPGDPAALPGARGGPLPRTLSPQLATLSSAVPEGDEWVHELKHDGYRLIARVEGRDVRLITRAGNDWTDRFPTLAAAVGALGLDSALLDGEAVVLDEEGRSRFQALQESFAGGQRPVQLFVFDLPYLDGYDLRGCRLDDRKRLLREVVARAGEDSPIHYSDHQVGRGPAFLAEACRNGVEGVVSKRADAPYRSERGEAWIKVKCSRRQEFVIAGFTDPEGSRVGLGALLLGAHDAAGKLRYAGKVGTGFDNKTLTDLRKRLGAIQRDTPPVADAPRERGQHWVEPRLVGEVSFTEWTRDRRIRHPTFLGLREDKPAGEVRFEQEEVAGPPPPAGKARTKAKPAPEARSKAKSAPEARTNAPPVRGKGASSVAVSRRTPASSPSPSAGEPPPVRAVVAGVRLSNPDRVYFPESGITKSEIAQYYERMADRVLPGLVERPLSLVRCPEGREGECFYQKRAWRSIPASVPRVVVKKGRAAYAMVTDLPSLVSLVQVGVLELHVWGARADQLERPDTVVVDIDPDEGLPWKRVAEAAYLLREVFETVGLVPFVRSTGGKGLHVVVPLERRSSWEEVKQFAAAAAGQLVRAAPDRFTANMSKAKRPGKIFLDVFRNDPESTAIASWSTRARPGAPVAATLAWDEIEGDEAPRVTLRDAPARLDRPDPWASYERSRRRLTEAMGRRLGAR